MSASTALPMEAVLVSMDAALLRRFGNGWEIYERPQIKNAEHRGANTAVVI